MSRHLLPTGFHCLIDEHCNPLISWLKHQRCQGKPLLFGINGAQGTGKSTLADFVQLALTEGEGWRVAVLSIDDFYLSRTERKQLSEEIHPLLITRGVPGTHDLSLLSTCIEQLRQLDAGTRLAVPRFDKAQDNRAAGDTWPIVAGPVDLIILEGWCVGSRPQAPDALSSPINTLEHEQDPAGTWRRFVNRQLEEGYAKLFAELDFLLLLQAPDFESVFRWRLEQEEKLAAISADDSTGIMDRVQIANFMQHYERLTRANFKALPNIADIVFEFDDKHNCVRSRYIS